MDKIRTQFICLEMMARLNSIIIELAKDNPYYGYLDEKLKPIENDIKCVREEIESSKKV